ncbi:MAG: hypothetical protein PHQ81_05390 [Methanofollis sp.]|nr:hypothetical protein [Methanofollis sp.]
MVFEGGIAASASSSRKREAAEGNTRVMVIHAAFPTPSSSGGTTGEGREDLWSSLSGGCERERT